jgi:hypothetical protein
MKLLLIQSEQLLRLNRAAVGSALIAGDTKLHFYGFIKRKLKACGFRGS